MTKTDLRDMVADIAIWLDAQTVDTDGHLGNKTLMDIIDQMVNVVALCQTELLK